MSKWTRNFHMLLLGAVLAAGVSCTSDSPVEPTSDPVSGQPPVPQGSTGPLGEEVKNVHLLSCTREPYAVQEQVIGPQGGSLSIGRHKLEIPSGALSSRVRIKAEQVPGNVNSVRLSPEGLQFLKPARLELSYRNCTGIRSPKRVAYTDELLRILDLPSSEDYPKYEYVSGAIQHFSRYAVAY
jgi:hypothetical protein